MAFRDFGYPGVEFEFGLAHSEADLFGRVPALTISSDFIDRIRTDAPLAVVVNSEKARSEFVVAPILLELRRLLGGTFGLFSGIAFDVDASKGLTGFCDFLLTRSPFQALLSAPVVAIVEAKNDNIWNGMGQCIASMVAAREFNSRSSPPVTVVHGVVTTGSAWKFLRLVDSTLTLDTNEFYIAEAGRIMGILAHILESA